MDSAEISVDIQFAATAMRRVVAGGKVEQNLVGGDPAAELDGAVKLEATGKRDVDNDKIAAGALDRKAAVGEVDGGGKGSLTSFWTDLFGQNRLIGRNIENGFQQFSRCLKY